MKEFIKYSFLKNSWFFFHFWGGFFWIAVYRTIELLKVDTGFSIAEYWSLQGHILTGVAIAVIYELYQYFKQVKSDFEQYGRNKFRFFCDSVGDMIAPIISGFVCLIEINNYPFGILFALMLWIFLVYLQNYLINKISN